jgi:hypothetical protein
VSLCARYRKLVAAGKPKVVAVTAIAQSPRELSAPKARRKTRRNRSGMRSHPGAPTTQTGVSRQVRHRHLGTSAGRSIQENHSLNLEKHWVDGELWHRN